jgi:hypothetical protein
LSTRVPGVSRNIAGAPARKPPSANELGFGDSGRLFRPLFRRQEADSFRDERDSFRDERELTEREKAELLGRPLYSGDWAGYVIATGRGLPTSYRDGLGGTPRRDP